MKKLKNMFGLIMRILTIVGTLDTAKRIYDYYRKYKEFEDKKNLDEFLSSAKKLGLDNDKMKKLKDLLN